MENPVQDPNEAPAGHESCRTTGCPSCGGSKVLLLGLVAVAGAFLFAELRGRSSESAVRSAVPWVSDYNSALKTAAEKNQPVFLAFKATWCGPCKWMDREVFSKPQAEALLSGWVAVHIDIDKEGRLSDQYRIDGVPTFVALSPRGKEVARASGALPMDELASFLASAQAATSRPG